MARLFCFAGSLAKHGLLAEPRPARLVAGTGYRSNLEANSFARVGFYSTLAKFKEEYPNLSGEATVEECGDLQVNKVLESNSSNNEKGCWWVPDPVTGIWVPEGEKLHTKSLTADSQIIWFRAEDVEPAYSFFPYN